MAAMRVTNVPTTLASFAEASLKLGLSQQKVFDPKRKPGVENDYHHCRAEGA
jgi:hypothetical protein